MTDDVQRRLADIEKRLARLERMAEKPPVQMHGEYSAYIKPDRDGKMQWCSCGRDVCRAPDCPTHRKEA